MFLRNRTRPILTTLAACAALVTVLACVGAAQGTSGAGAGTGSAVVAHIGDRPITLDEVDAKAKETSLAPFQQLYDARRQALDQIIEGRLLESEASSRGVSRDELVKQEISQKIAAVTDADIQTFFTQNQNRMGGRTLDQVGPQIRGFLAAQREAEARGSFVDQLKAKAAVKITLDPPRVDIKVAADDPAMGPANAPVTIVEFSDFQCPYCARVGPTLESIREKYGEKVRIVFRDYPLAFHQQALPAAAAAQCAHEQGKFWDYHDKLFANQSALMPDNLKQYAADLGLDAAKFSECVDSGRHQAAVQADFEYGQRVGVTGTPAFFINGRFLNGAKPFEEFAQIIDEELARM